MSTYGKIVDMTEGKRDLGLRLRAVLVTSATLSLLAASPVESVRQGNAAFERGDFAVALRHYQQAEALASDPGLVAYNMAAAHYALQQYSAAEQCYRRALEDADGPRRVRALYGLGNALARQGQERRGRAAVQRLLAAKKALTACIAEEPNLAEEARTVCGATIADARFNLRLVEELLERKRAEAQADPPGADEGSGTDSSNDRGSDRDPRTGDSKNGPEKKGTSDSKGPQQPGAAGAEKPQPGSQPPPGKGDLPPLLGDPNAPPLDSGDARAHLQAALDRIRHERAQHTAPPPGAATHVKDW
jgi:tetratricopeptide (TPR) repeat protein